ncbi:response regulator transcription factor [Spongiactinospora gelatinilytica]|uniref:response regulator transcription factor n=1 Tax=Spongiactinospora gelatinilytica TaxID=2666298 RepID=UPI001F41513B|nr:LuxR C-terminal-related transcriptional regulator [Spongiactinospora gelatinilytica]
MRTVADGNAILAPAVTRRLINTFAGQRPPDVLAARRRLAVLTPREDAVVRAVARGLANGEIARELAVSETSVKAHVSRALTKLGLTNRVQIALLVRDADQ